jgi:hypothetical protein
MMNNENKQRSCSFSISHSSIIVGLGSLGRRERIGSQFPHLFYERGNVFGKLRTFGRGNPLHPKPFRFDAGKSQEFLHEGHSFFGHEVSSQIMAIANMAASDKNTVQPFLKGFQDVMGGYGPGTHDPNGPYIGRVLQPADPCQVSCGIGSPGAQKAENFGFKMLGHNYLFVQ